MEASREGRATLRLPRRPKDARRRVDEAGELDLGAASIVCVRRSRLAEEALADG